jgi:hypothetical protein
MNMKSQVVIFWILSNWPLGVKKPTIIKPWCLTRNGSVSYQIALFLTPYWARFHVHKGLVSYLCSLGHRAEAPGKPRVPTALLSLATAGPRASTLPGRFLEMQAHPSLLNQTLCFPRIPHGKYWSPHTVPHIPALPFSFSPSLFDFLPGPPTGFIPWFHVLLLPSYLAWAFKTWNPGPNPRP